MELVQIGHMNDMPALHPDLAIGETLRATASQILAEARAVVDDSARADAVAVHDFRREIKRWRALLRLLLPFLGEEARQLRTEAGTLARSLGGARDAQSALDAFNDLVRRDLALSEHLLASIRSRLDTSRQAAETTLLTAEARQHILQGLADAARAVELWAVQDITFADVATSLTRGYRTARRAMPGDWTEANPEALHELRKAVISHRYQMDIVLPLWRRFGRMWIGEAQRLRGRLGAHQDLLLLERMTEPHRPLARWRSQLQPAITVRKAEHVRGARRIAERLLFEKPKSFRRRLEAMWETAS